MAGGIVQYMHSHNSQDRRENPENHREFYENAKEPALEVIKSLIDDAYLNLFNSCDLPDRHRDICTLERRYASEGISFFATVLPRLAEGLFGFFEYGDATYPNFRLKSGKNYPLFLGRMFELAHNSTGTACETQHIMAVRMIYQISVAFKKLRGPSKPGQLEGQISSFIEVDQGLPELPRDPELKEILDESRRICKNLFRNFDQYTKPDLFLPRPGPGGTNEPVPHHKRFRPQVMFESIDEYLPYQEWFYHNPWEACNQSKSFLQLYKKRVATPTVRYKSVPKQFQKDRGICIEHNETQYLQQAAKNAFYKHLESHPLTTGQISFTDQSINQRLALESSETRELGTLDMKEASDRVSRQLVLYHFEDNEALTDLLMALSTPVISFKTELKNVAPLLTKKYAAMGSGLCFPVMATMHYCLIKAIYKLCARKYNLPNLSKEPVYVFGDDIIVPTYLVADVFHYLPKFGMKFNEKKSFWRSGFRESCGVHAYKGVDITPVYIKYIPNLNCPDSLLSGLANEADLYERGLYKTASCLRTKINLCMGEALPYVGRESACLGFMRGKRADINKLRVSTKYRFRKQMPLVPFLEEWVETDTRMEFLLWKAIPVREKDPPFEEAEGYLRYLVTNSEEHDNNFGRVETMKLVQRWVPEPSL